MKRAILFLATVVVFNSTASNCQAQPEVLPGFGSYSDSNPGNGNQQNFAGQNYGNQNYGNQNYSNQNYGNQNYGNQDFGDSNFGNQNFGNNQNFNNHKVQNFGTQNYGIAGRTANNSFNSGLSSVSRTTKRYTRPLPNHSRSTQAMLQLSGTLKRASQAWSHVNVNMAPLNQALAQPATGISGILPPMSRKEMMRIFIDGGTPQLNNRTAGFGSAPPGPPSTGSDASYVYSNFRTAEKEANLASDACDRARYKDESSDKAYEASEAEYCASNAEYAAQCAESTAFALGDPQSQDYAYRARSAANRARGSAKSARYYADCDAND